MWTESLTPDNSPLAIGAFSLETDGLLLLIHIRKTLTYGLKQLLFQQTLLLVGGLSAAIYPQVFIHQQDGQMLLSAMLNQ